MWISFGLLSQKSAALLFERNLTTLFLEALPKHGVDFIVGLFKTVAIWHSVECWCDRVCDDTPVRHEYGGQRS